MFSMSQGGGMGAPAFATLLRPGLNINRCTSQCCFWIRIFLAFDLVSVRQKAKVSGTLHCTCWSTCIYVQATVHVHACWCKRVCICWLKHMSVSENNYSWSNMCVQCGIHLSEYTYMCFSNNNNMFKVGICAFSRKHNVDMFLIYSAIWSK